jgi:hypothetical protein
VTADAPPSRAADANSSVTSTEFNSQLKEHFVRMLLVPQLLPHPARKCVERFVAMCESTVLRLGGATTALRSRGEDELLFACPFGAVRVRDVVEVFLLDRVFFISALCDKWIQCMFRDRGIPHTVELGAPGDTTSSTSTGLTGSSRLAPGSGSSSDFGEPRSLTWQSRQVAGGVTWGRDVPKVDISDPVRIFLPELIDSQIDAHALRLLLEEGEGPVAPERSAEAPPSVLSDQLLLRGLSEKLAEQLLGLIARLPAMPFVAAFYESLMDLLVSAYNVVEFAALEECGTAVGADSVFPLLVNVLSSIPRATQRLWRLLKWMDNSTVARQLPIFKSKGLSSYVLLSFTAAVEVAISEKTTV